MIAIRRLPKGLIFSTYRHISSNVETSKGQSGISVVSLNLAPVNSLGPEFMSELIEALDRAEKDKSCKGIVLTSSLKSVFCAGLDLKEMYQPDENRLREFWSTLQELWLRLYGLKVPAGAAINGHAPAAGALLASCCDYRAMVKSDKATIGLNEAKFGLVAPFWFMDSFMAVVGRRNAEHALLTGKLYKVSEAHQVGLVDVVTETKEAAVDECNKALAEMGACVPRAWYLTKMSLREGHIDRLRSRRRQDVDNFVSLVFEEQLQESLGAYLASLGKKTK